MNKRAASIAGVSGTANIGPVSGRLEGFYLAIGDQDAGTIDITITDKETGAALLTITNKSNANAWYPVRVAEVDNAGAALLYAAGGTAQTGLYPIDGSINVSWAQGTAARTATLYAYVSGC